MIDLSGKIFLVTGTTRGIGKAIKQVCEAQGARVIPHASRPHAETDDSYIYEDLSQPGAGKRPRRDFSFPRDRQRQYCQYRQPGGA